MLLKLNMHSLESIMLLPILVSAASYHFTAGLDAGKTITVNPSGGGAFTMVQAAIDLVPDGNRNWIQILVKAGFYNEKVNVPRGKQFIFLKGEGINTTVIQWGGCGHIPKSPTFLLYADNFVASDITFSNTYNGKNIIWNPAAMAEEDKVSFYHCGFTGQQDTLTDWKGDHYYESCFIRGAADFIWGGGQLMFKGCVIYADAAVLGRVPGGPGYITAQSRNDPKDPSGFVFERCSITETGRSYLGRAHGSHSRVIFFQTNMDDVIVPEGWNAWNYVGQEREIAYSEEGCTGPGANLLRRAWWMKKLGRDDVFKFIDLKSFINQDGWMEKQPIQPH